MILRLEILIGQSQNWLKCGKKGAHLLSIFQCAHLQRACRAGAYIFSKDAYENIRQYSKIIGIKQKFAPCFDTVVVDRSEQRIELRVDVPSAHVPNEIQQIANQHVLGSFNALSYQGCQTSIVGLSAFDFFPMLLPLYRDNTAGKVSTLGFAAYAEDSASNNTGRPIRKRVTTYGRINFIRVERRQSKIFVLTRLVSNGQLLAAKTK